MKTKNLKDYLNKNKKKVKVIEDSRARESICKTIEEIVFSDEILSSDIMSSDLLSEVDCVKKSKKECGSIKSKESESIGSKPIEVTPIESVFIECNLIKCKSLEVTSPIECNPIEVTTPIETTTPLEVTTPISLNSRINKIKQFTNLNFNLDLNKLDTYLILPKPLLRLLKIFKSLLTIQNYNSIRKLTSIFIKVKGSIERTLRTRVEEEDIKKIYYLLGDKIEIKNLKIEDKGEMVKTFTFKIKCTGEEMEKRMREWCMEEKGKEVPCREWEEDGGEECGEDVKEMEVGGKDKEGKDMDGNNPITPSNLPSIDNPISPSNNLLSFKNPSPVTPSPLTTPSLSQSSTTKALNKTNSILERIKEKELKRKQEFIKKIQKKNEERDLIKRISILFKKEGKQALKMKDVIKILEIFEGERQIKGIVKENPGEFEIREISEEKYLIYKKVI